MSNKESLQKKVTVDKKNTGADEQRSAFLLYIVRFRNLIILFEILLLSVVGYFFLLAPKFEAITDASTEDVAYWEDQLATAKKNRASADRLVRLYNELDATERDKLQKILPSGKQIPELMSQFEALLDSEEVLMQDFAASPVDFGEGAVMPFHIMQVQVTFTAPEGYASFTDVLKKFENNIRIFNIQNFTYSRNTESFTLTGYVYYL